MKESRFIELLNLYVDQQLSKSEASELEGEIARNHARRTTYQEYCRMQKACTLLFEQERNHAPRSTALATSLREADRKIIAFPDAQTRTPRGYYPIGLLAAAACVAFVFVRFNAPVEPARVPSSAALPISATPAQPSLVALSPVAVAPTSQVAPREDRANYFSVFALGRAQPSIAESDKAELLTTSSDISRGVSYDWMQEIEMEPVQSLSPSRLTLQTTSLVPAGEEMLRSRKPVQGTAEMTAFTFQR